MSLRFCVCGLVTVNLMRQCFVCCSVLPMHAPMYVCMYVFMTMSAFHLMWAAQALAVEHAHEGIRVNMIAPGIVKVGPNVNFEEQYVHVRSISCAT